jgi:deoxyribodipyrimidine photolyase-like uncharacterized protein
MLGRFNDDFVGAGRVHAIVNSFRGARGIAFDVIERPKMRVCADLRWPLLRQVEQDLRLQAIFRAQRTRIIGPRFFAFLMADDNPTASDWIFTKFHFSV